MLPAVLLRGPELCNVQAWSMWHVNNKNIWKNKELYTRSLQLHHVGYLVPTESYESVVLKENKQFQSPLRVYTKLWGVGVLT